LGSVVGLSLGLTGGKVSVGRWDVGERWENSSHAAGVFDAEGHLTDEGTNKRLREFVVGFVEYIRS